MPMSIGFVGYSTQGFDESRACALITKIFNIIEKYDPIIVSGLTNLGIPGLVYKEANSRGLKTVGIACKKAEEYDCYPVDEMLIVGDEWGDESDTFKSSIDFLIKIGGGMQSEEEFNSFLGNKASFKI